MLDAIALGELLIDFATVDTDRDGYPTLAAHPGGAPGNFLAALHAYGCSGAMLGKVGADTFGDLLCATLAQAGIRTEGIVRDPSVFTTLAFVTFGPGGERAFSFARKPGADTQLRFDELDLSLLDEARLLHFGSLSLTQEPVRSATQQAAAYAAAHGKLLSFDPNLRLPLWPDAEAAKTQILWGLRQADIVKISDDEVRFLWGCGPEEGAARLLADFGVRLAMVTCGPKGCLLQNAGGSRPRGRAARPAGRHNGRGRYFRRQRRQPPAAAGPRARGADGGRADRHRPLRRHGGQPVHAVPRRHLRHRPGGDRAAVHGGLSKKQVRNACGTHFVAQCLPVRFIGSIAPGTVCCFLTHAAIYEIPQSGSSCPGELLYASVFLSLRAAKRSLKTK